MKLTARNRPLIAELAASQHGLLTAEQLHRPLHVAQSLLRTLTRAGELYQLEGGVYLHAAHVETPFTEPLAAVIATQPDLTLRDRGSDAETVLTGNAVAHRYGLHSLMQDTIIYTHRPVANQLRFENISYEVRAVPEQDITWQFGIATASVERILADALQYDGDLEHVAEALQDAAWLHSLDIERLRLLIVEAAPSGTDGRALWNQLIAMIGGFPTHDGFAYPIRPMIGRQRRADATDSPELRAAAAALGITPSELILRIERTMAHLGDRGRIDPNRVAAIRLDTLLGGPAGFARIARGWTVVLLSETHEPALLAAPAAPKPTIRAHRAERNGQHGRRFRS
jgi:hypothetical protein